ncbi:hypothetical protein I7I50_12462 [Histoplasma capsulatum G186AR]|uniref:Uncharacterized protein n=1 Tax=Ajellomyces capsulatus TaxID=5037 RepID=A0A8H7Y7W6_AJECA|nr:hypothetical protein I7I52_11231 [Histoplasma capsulatum]QSS70733.1 hypothetical protein I7I50_12462 [Histoplasma capsulatum G186AR]
MVFNFHWACISPNSGPPSGLNAPRLWLQIYRISDTLKRSLSVHPKVKKLSISPYSIGVDSIGYPFAITSSNHNHLLSNGSNMSSHLPAPTPPMVPALFSSYLFLLWNLSRKTHNKCRKQIPNSTVSSRNMNCALTPLLSLLTITASKYSSELCRLGFAPPSGKITHPP